MQELMCNIIVNFLVHCQYLFWKLTQIIAMCVSFVYSVLHVEEFFSSPQMKYKLCQCTISIVTKMYFHCKIIKL
jgi:hypothetical protein